MQVYGRRFLLPEITSSIRTIVNSSNTLRIPEVFTQIATITLSKTLSWLLLKKLTSLHLHRFGSGAISAALVAMCSF